MSFTSDAQRKAVFAKLGKNQFVATTYIPAGAPYPFDGAYERQQEYLDEYERERRERERDSLLENLGEAAIGGIGGTALGYALSPSYEGGTFGSLLRLGGGAVGGGAIGGGLSSLLPGGLLTTVPGAAAGAGLGAASQFYSMYPRALYGGLIGAALTPALFSRLPERGGEGSLEAEHDLAEREAPLPVDARFDSLVSELFPKTREDAKKIFGTRPTMQMTLDGEPARNQMSLLYGKEQYFDEDEAAEWQRRYELHKILEARREEEEARQRWTPSPVQRAILEGAAQSALMYYGGPIAGKLTSGASNVIARVPGVTKVSAILGRPA